MYDLSVSQIETPLGVPLEMKVYYDSRNDRGGLSVTSSHKSLLWLSPLTRQSTVILTLHTDEEFVVSLRDAT